MKKIGIFLYILFAILTNNIFCEKTTFNILPPLTHTFLTNLHQRAFHPRTVYSWYNLAKDRASDAQTPLKCIVNSKTLQEQCQNYIAMQKNFFDKSAWVSAPLKFDDNWLDEFQPFVFKYQLPAYSYLYIFGDMHGDVQALSSVLYKLFKENIIQNNFKIINKDTYFFFLGDLIDRGAYGPDLLSLLFTFALVNKGRVFILRGNHEDSMLASRYGFRNQLSEMLNQESADATAFDPLYETCEQFFNTLPNAAFVGCDNNYLQFCHGGLEVRYNPKKLFACRSNLCFETISELHMPDEFNESTHKDWYKPLNIDQLSIGTHSLNSVDVINPVDLGFLWNDFRALNSGRFNTATTSFNNSRGTGLMIGKTFGEKIFELYSSGTAHVKGIIRAHQHNATMPGLFKTANTGVFSLWDNKVLTTIGTGIYTKASAFLKLTLHHNFEKWQLTSYNLPKPGEWHKRKALIKDWKNIED